MIWLCRGMTIDGIHLDRWQAGEVFFEARRIAREEGRLRRWPAVLLAVPLALPMTCVFGPLIVILLPPGRDLGTAMMLGAVIGIALALVAGPASVLAFRLRHHRDIRRAMGLAGYPMCVACGYSHRGLPLSVQRCPECGTERPAPREET